MIQGGKIIAGEITLGEKSISNMSESEFDDTIRWKEISMVFQGAMNSLDPVFTIEQQFDQILKQHDFTGDFQKTMHNLKGTTTIILIAHRLSTIREADTIFFMDKGKIIERGSHDELIELNGYYNNYVRLQSTN